MVIRGLWNVSGQGYVRIPEEYREFAQEKKKQLLSQILLIYIVSFVVALAVPLIDGSFNELTPLKLMDSFLWVFVLGFSHIYAV